MDFSVCTLASSSSGNAHLVSAGSSRILVDAGLSGKRIQLLLERIEVDPTEIRAIVLTHEHDDHIQGVGVLARRWKIPVLATTATFRAGRERLKELPERVDLHPGRPLPVAGMTLTPFETFHDAAGSVGLVVSHGERRLGIATDLGHVSNVVAHRLTGCSTVVLETNYDPVMLREGPYPWPLKQRIQGRRGHLSNGDSCGLIARLARTGLKRVILAHLSETNNHPDVVMRALVDGLPPDIMERTEFIMTFPDAPSAVVRV